MKKRFTSLILVVAMLLLAAIPSAFTESTVQTFQGTIYMEYETGGQGSFRTSLATSTIRFNLLRSPVTDLFYGAEFPNTSDPTLAKIEPHCISATKNSAPYKGFTITMGGQKIQITVNGGSMTLVYRSKYYVSATGQQSCTAQETVNLTFSAYPSYDWR